MVALPSLTAVTNPLASTVATAVLLLDHESVLFVASFGDTVPVSLTQHGEKSARQNRCGSGSCQLNAAWGRYQPVKTGACSIPVSLNK